MTPSTAAASLHFAAGRPVAVRFLWKELRVLRGLALGMILLTVCEMLASLGFLRPTDRAAWMAISAFGGAALFVVGAAVMLFSVERDEGTAILLHLLPQNRPAMLLGKMAAGVLATLVVLLVLLLLGISLANGNLPPWPSSSMILSQGSVILAEALAWGVLMSLLCPNPLLAAVLALAAAAFNSQLAMFVTVRDAAGFTIDDFQAAIPGRLALVAVIASVDVLLGLRWPAARHSSRVVRRSPPAAKAVLMPTTGVTQPSFKSMFIRLFWQTVRQSWKSAAAAIAIGCFLMFAVEIILRSTVRLDVLQPGASTIVSALFIPALLGALVFRADQRAGQYRFLAEHGGRPRVLWLARHAFWLTLVLAVGLVVLMGAWWWLGAYLVTTLQNFTRGWDVFDLGFAASWSPAANLAFESYLWLALRLMTVGCVSWLAAYAVGQFFSLALRSDVLAGVIALLASMIILLWFYIVAVWRLSPWVFVLPIVVAGFTASWWRVSDWIFDRPGWRRWVVPSLLLVVPLLALVALVPPARLAQVSGGYPVAPSAPPIRVDQHAAAAERQFAAGRQVLNAYQVLSNRIGEAAQEGDNTVILPTSSGSFDEELLALSHIDCRLPLVKSDPRLDIVQGIAHFALQRARALATEDLDQSLELVLAGARIQSQLYRGLQLLADSSSGHWRAEPASLDSIWVHWATAPGQTPQRIKRALAQRAEIDRLAHSPFDGIINDYLDALEVVRGRRPPEFLLSEHRSQRDWAVYHLSRFPGEANRGEKALEILAAAAIDSYRDAYSMLESSTPATAGMGREQLRTAHDFNGGMISLRSPLAVLSTVGASGSRSFEFFQERAKAVSAARTSYLAADHLEFLRTLKFHIGRWFADAARRRLERVRLALIAYRLEHGEYPPNLAALTPDYLPSWDLVDPYSAEPIGYQPAGFELPFAQLGYRTSELHPPHTPLVWTVGEQFSAPEEVDVWVQATENVEASVLSHRPFDGSQDGTRPLRAMRLVPRELPPAYQRAANQLPPGYGAIALPLPTN